MHIGSTSQEKTKNPSMDLFIYHNVLVQIANNVSITKNQFVHIVGQSWMQKLQRIQQSTRKSAFFMKKYPFTEMISSYSACETAVALTVSLF